MPEEINRILTDRVGYFDMLWLEKHARTVITNSGGVQKIELGWRWNSLCEIVEKEIIEKINRARAGEWAPVF